MEFVVIFTNGDRPAYHHAADLEEALRFIEHLKNAENVGDVRLFRMQQIPLEFKPYFKVEVSGTPGAPQPALAAQAAEA